MTTLTLKPISTLIILLLASTGAMAFSQTQTQRKPARPGSVKASPDSPPAPLESNQTQATASTVATPAEAGLVRVCLAPASAQMAAGNTDEAIQAVRDAFSSFLKGPTLTVSPLTARLSSQLKEEARLGQCSYVLFTSLTHKKKEGSGLFSKMATDAAGSAVWGMPGGGNAASAALRMAGSIKAKDELTLEYRLEAADGSASRLAKTEKAKAKRDGEDLLTPLVQKASEAMAAVSKTSETK